MARGDAQDGDARGGAAREGTARGRAGRGGSARRGGRGGAAGFAPALPGALEEQWKAISGHVGGLPDEAFAGPSALPGWTTAELVLHTARSALALSAALRGDPAPGLAGGSAGGSGGGPVGGSGAESNLARTGGAPLVTAADYLAGTGARAEAIAATARDLAAGQAPEAVREAFRDAVTGAAADLARLPPDEIADRLVIIPGGRMRLGEFLLTRAVEAVVHGLDLGVPPARPALKTAVRLFTSMLAERAPGHAVELRVPPFSAVQIVEGPRHTRGTPPNVVEADPAAFVLIATGRLAWEAALADGRIRASGERADLRFLLPLLA
ncbi:maleylpyruvate isomerase N-terminal domain-containing protein [Frankia sp. Mgl5]|uniref:sterol carrier family protein n=1 Tax=Frankia sp. Mgl5 TaxID=2933793 RepID=UPI00200CBB19|nr:sterol carrier family protein [Frankia sp. Mgl5]MCK9930985.1 maleylpyruvate isomerase N-terminal domain-containing protein [Frankia sp. Mgl5]